MLQQGHLEQSTGSLMGQRGPLQGLTGGFDSRTLHHQKFMHIYSLLWATNNVPTDQTAYLRFINMLPSPANSWRLLYCSLGSHNLPRFLT